jgi:hypothetical protein
VWIVALVLALVPLVVAFARVELRRITPPSPSAVRAGVAAVLLAAGMAVLARKGFVPAGIAGGGLVVGGWAVLRRA